MDFDLKWLVIGLIIAFVISYIWLGEGYHDLKEKHEVLQGEYIQLNESYNELQHDYTNLEKECGQVLKDYKTCVGRETFFVWIDRFFSLRNLAKLLGLI